MVTTARRWSVTCALSLAAVVLICCSAHAGTLDDFEDEATESSSSVRDTVAVQETYASNCLGSIGWALVKGVGQGVGQLLWIGGEASLQRMAPASLGDTVRMGRRVPGEFQLPFAAIDLQYQHVESDIRALGGRAEIGHGLIGLGVSHAHFLEDHPDDELGVTRWHALYRMSLDESFEIDVGLGSIILAGNETNSGFSMTVPVRIDIEETWAADVRPTWGWVGDNTIIQVDAGVMYLWQHVSATLGYRWLTCGDSELNGAFVGVSARL